MSQYRPGVHWLAIAAALVTYLLLTLGGVVTSREAGLIFEDWPLSRGSINPEGWIHNPDERAEHGHRLLGALAGILTIALAVSLQRRDERRFVRRLGWVALVAVCVQGVLGGLRVTEISGNLALLHGCTGQAFFCLMVALVYYTSRDARRSDEMAPEMRHEAIAAGATVFALYMQVVLGAQLRHVGGPITVHLFGAVLAAGSVVWLVTRILLRHDDKPGLVKPALFLGFVLLVQLALGVYTAHVLVRYDADYITRAQVLLPTAHQSVGAVMLATAVVVWLRTLRRAEKRSHAVEGVFA
jgi:cytochrome c oxidase assembly protein subunit 15